MKVKFKSFSKLAQNSVRATSGSAGYDLLSANKVELKPKSIQKMSTGIGLKNRKTHYWRICSYTCYTLQYTGVGAGPLNSDYRGNFPLYFLTFHTDVIKLKLLIESLELFSKKFRPR